jgi:hypothetical protein
MIRIRVYGMMCLDLLVVCSSYILILQSRTQYFSYSRHNPVSHTVNRSGGEDWYVTNWGGEGGMSNFSAICNFYYKSFMFQVSIESHASCILNINAYLPTNNSGC